MSDERRLRLSLSARYLLSSMAFWIGMAYIILALFAVWIYYEGNRTTREASIRASKQAADISSRRAACLRSIPQLKQINGFLAGVGVLAQVLETNSQAFLAVTPTSDPKYQVLSDNLDRLGEATRAIEGIHFPVPTKARCDAITS